MNNSIFFIIVDLTKAEKDPARMYFYERWLGVDLAGTLAQFAEQNETSIKKLRLFVLDKDSWEREYEKYCSLVAWSTEPKVIVRGPFIERNNHKSTIRRIY